MTDGEGGAPAKGPRHPAERVWVLTGSIGAISAAIRFFRAMPPDRPVAYVVAIRASIEGLALTEKLLAKTTSFTIHSSGLERTLYPRDVLLVPIDGEAWLEHTVQRSRPGPSPQPIDEVLTTVGARYRDRAGAIILSGIGAEGAVGCQAISRFGGQVWTQDSESSEYSSLPKYIRGVCEVGFAGTPEALADRLARALTPPPAPRPGGMPNLRDRPSGPTVQGINP